MTLDLISTIHGQDQAWRALFQSREKGRLHHAYRFEGPPGVGKTLSAFAYAQWLLCEKPTSAASCGDCHSCHRIQLPTYGETWNGRHPDLVYIAKGAHEQFGTEASGIKVEQIRKLVLDRVGYGSHENRGLVVIIRNAEDLSSGAANALLKTLEEPPKDFRFVITTSSSSMLLDTIRSRTLALRFSPLSDRLIADLLKSHQRELTEISSANGSISQALQLTESSQIEARQEFLSRVREALSAKLPDRSLVLAAELSNEKVLLPTMLDALSATYAHRGLEAANSGNERAELFAASYEACEHAKRRISAHGNAQLVIEQLLLNLRKLIRGN